MFLQASMFLSQIANFIMTNSKQTTTNFRAGEFADPFTGGNRYIPGSSDDQSVNISSAPKPDTHVSYIPQKTYLKLEQANVTAIIGKTKY